MNARNLILFVLPAASSACMATYRIKPQEYVPQNNPSQILVMDNAGAIYVMEGPQIVGDKLVGVESGTPDTISVPVAQVEDALVKHHSKGRTFALIGGLTAGAGLAVLGIITQGNRNPCRTAANKTQSGRADPGGTSQCDTSGDGPVEAPF